MIYNKFYYIIDSIAPFVLPRCINNGQVINWSKIPFTLLERNGSIPAVWCDQIQKRFENYVSTVTQIGFNAISIDDLTHLSLHPFYPKNLHDKIFSYQQFFDKLFTVALGKKLEIFINTDAAYPPDKHSTKPHIAIDSMLNLCKDLFLRFPTVKGVILRLGECDGVDVKGEVRSNLVFRKASHTRDLIREMVNLFKHYERLLIVRTWTVGAYEIGDLIWNPKTYDKIFDGITNNNIIVSHKYGDSDFYKFLKLNPLIFHGEQRKIVEFQARREYEGFGEFPSFVGYDYEKYRDQLKDCKRLNGIQVWCQTGGWSRFHKTTFMPGSSIWNEINTHVTISLFRENKSTDEIVEMYARNYYPDKDPRILIQLMKLSDLVIRSLWYIPEFSEQIFFFRRLRIPPLIWIFWDIVIVNATICHLLRQFIGGKIQDADIGEETLEKIETMKKYANALGISTEDFDFQHATFEILVLIRKFIIGDWTNDIKLNLKEIIKKYSLRYPNGFVFNCEIADFISEKRGLIKFISILIRNQPQYRPLEKKFWAVILIIVRPMVKYWGRKKLPGLAVERAMGIGVLLK